MHGSRAHAPAIITALTKQETRDGLTALIEGLGFTAADISSILNRSRQHAPAIITALTKQETQAGLAALITPTDGRSFSLNARSISVILHGSTKYAERNLNSILEMADLFKDTRISSDFFLKMIQKIGLEKKSLSMAKELLEYGERADNALDELLKARKDQYKTLVSHEDKELKLMFDKVGAISTKRLAKSTEQEAQKALLMLSGTDWSQQALPDSALPDLQYFPQNPSPTVEGPTAKRARLCDTSKILQG